MCTVQSTHTHPSSHPDLRPMLAAAGWCSLTLPEGFLAQRHFRIKAAPTRRPRAVLPSYLSSSLQHPRRRKNLCSRFSSVRHVWCFPLLSSQGPFPKSKLWAVTSSSSALASLDRQISPLRVRKTLDTRSHPALPASTQSPTLLPLRTPGFKRVNSLANPACFPIVASPALLSRPFPFPWTLGTWIHIHPQHAARNG